MNKIKNRCLLLLLLLLLLTGGFHAGEHGNPRCAEVTHILGQIDTLLTYSLNVDPREGDGGQGMMVSEFHDCLVKLCHANSSHLLFSRLLVNKVVMGVYKRRGHAIKYRLSSEGYETVQQSDMQSLPEWANSTDILVELLHFRKSEECNGGGAHDEGGVAGDQGYAGGAGRVAGGRVQNGQERAGDQRHGKAQCRERVTSGTLDMHPLDFAVKLGLMDIVTLLVQAGTVCVSSDAVLCKSALHYAIINQDLVAMHSILGLIQSEWATSMQLSQQLCDLLTLSNLTFGRSPLDIAYFQCNSGLSCDTLTYILPWARTSCARSDYSPQGFPYDHLTCPVMQHNPILSRSSDVTLKHRWLRCVTEGRGCEFDTLSGFWRVYGDHSVGRMDCGLIRIAAGSITPAEFERDFVNMSIPVVISGLTGRWPLLQAWRRDKLLQQHAEMDMLVGPIPYGEVFGEHFGFATVKEFLAYMDGYAMDASVEVSHPANFNAPLYVFDGKLMQSHFSGEYSLKGFYLSQSISHHPQFILGPAGSGAPFHFHCHAMNALIYGRKKWYLYPPGHAVYSKQHPLLWYRTQFPTATINRPPLECVQGPGDVLYVPARWSHATINIDECIGMAVEFNTGDC